MKVSMIAATIKRPRLTLADPIREPLKVNMVDPNAQQIAVVRAAISP
jgi:hypothetical protein